MKWNILHESRGRIRLHLRKPRMSLAEADQLQDYLTSLPGVRTAAVYERTCDVVIVYTESRAGIVRGLAAFRFDTGGPGPRCPPTAPAPSTANIRKSSSI